jgi:uncharacterized protein (TIGR02145 family)
VNALGCPGTTNKTIDIQPLPVVTFTTSTPSPVCQDYPTPSLYTVTTGGAPASYVWQVTPPELATVANPTANPVSISWKLPSNSGAQHATLSLTATTTTTSPACTSTSSPAVITINPKPSTQLKTCFDLKTTTNAKPFTLRGGTPLGAGGVYYIDNLTNSPVTTFNPQVAGPGNHTIYYNYTNNNGCVAFATNQINVALPANFTCNSKFTDIRTGRTYATSRIGTQCWMKENLDYGKSVNSFLQPQTDNCVVERYCQPSDANCTQYGGFYQWDELMAYGFNQSQGLCPPGWHVPSESEWQTMLNIITGGSTLLPDGIAGSILKDSTSTASFIALTKGMFYLDNIWAFANGTPRGTMYWTSTSYDATRKAARGVNTINPSVSKYYGNKGNSFSVRCVQD